MATVVAVDLGAAAMVTVVAAEIAAAMGAVGYSVASVVPNI